MPDKYETVMPLRSIMSTVYTVGALTRCKRTLIKQIKPSDTVLFAGAGHGEDVIVAAALAGAHVTVVEISETMANRLATKYRHRVANSAIITDAYTIGTLKIVVKDIVNYKPIESFDYVVANFFLNIFDRTKMRSVLNLLEQLVKDKTGKIVISDFRYPTGNILSRIAQKLYWYIAHTCFCIISGSSFHKMYDYRNELSETNFTTSEVYTYAFRGVGFETVIAHKKENPE